MTPNVQSEGLRAFAQSLSNAGLGVTRMGTLVLLPCQLQFRPAAQPLENHTHERDFST